MSIDKKNKHLGLIVGISALALAASMQPSPAGAALSLVCPQPLIYGTFTISCGGASTTKITPSGTRSVTGCLNPQGAPFSRARCIVTQGYPFAAVQISVPSNGVLTRSGGTETMPLSLFNLVTNSNGAVYTTSGPYLSVPIGATLNVGASPVGGSYQGTFTINAVFQ